MDRRQFLRGAGVALALPALGRFSFAATGAAPRRILAICNNLGLVPEKFFPTQAGRDYPLSPYLEVLKNHRNDFTVFSGVTHPDVDGGHPADNCFLTCAPHPSNGGFRNTISLDQYLAQYIGHLTRFPSLTLGVNIRDGQRSLSWTAGGVLIPCEERPSAAIPSRRTARRRVASSRSATTSASCRSCSSRPKPAATIRSRRTSRC